MNKQKYLNFLIWLVAGGLLVIAVLAGGLWYILIEGNGEIANDRFVIVAGLIGGCVFGVVGIVRYFASIVGGILDEGDEGLLTKK